MKRADILKYSGSLDDYKDYLSWAIFSTVTLLGEASWRKFVFCKFINCSQISFGPSFKGKYHFKTLIKYLNKKSTKRFQYFTISDPVKIGTDTHFISCIADSQSKAIFIFNPAIGPRGVSGSIEDPVFTKSEKVVQKFYREKGHNIIYYPVSCAPQCTKDDVYCQSWSLISSIKGFPNILLGKIKPLRIPTKKEGRFNYILKFWKSLLNDPDFCKKLQLQYKVLRGSKGVINPKNPIEACELLKYSIAKDML